MFASRRRFLACHLLLVLTAALPAVARPKEMLDTYLGKTFYLKYNLFVSGFDADWKNELGDPDFIPIATKVKVSKVKSDAVYLDVEGKKRPVEVELDDVTPDAQTFLGRLLGSEPPSLEGLSSVDLSGIKAAAVTKGMSRRAVFLAVGYPPHYFTPHIPFAPMVRKVCANRSPDDAAELTYLESDRDFVRVTFANEIVVGVERD